MRKIQRSMRSLRNQSVGQYNSSCILYLYPLGKSYLWLGSQESHQYNHIFMCCMKQRLVCEWMSKPVIGENKYIGCDWCLELSFLKVTLITDHICEIWNECFTFCMQPYWYLSIESINTYPLYWHGCRHSRQWSQLALRFRNNCIDSLKGSV